MTKVIGDYDAAVSIDGSTNYLLIQPGNASTAYNKINRNVFLGVTGQPMDISTSQSVSNKTIGNTNSITVKDNAFTLQDNSDTTKQAAFELSGITTGNTRTLTVPDASTTLVGTGVTQTLTNKTLTSPTINNGSITGTTITTDAIVGQSASTSGTVYGLSISSSKVGSNGVVTASITDAAVTPAKLVTGTGSSWAYQSFIPTWTNFTVGNATTIYRFIQTGKTVEGYIHVTLGSTSVVGTSPSFTLPVPASTNQIPATASTFIPIGMALYSAGGVGADGALFLGSTGTALPVVYNAASTYLADNGLTAAIPGVWTTGNYMRITFKYEAA